MAGVAFYGSTKMITLLGLHYSPWTHRARWALDHCGIRYRYREYLPGVGEPLLRLRLRRVRGLVQVPVLFVDGAAVAGSQAIARYAASCVQGAPLGDFAACERWEVLGDAACAEARVQLIGRLLASSRAQEEALDGVIPRPVQPAFRWLSRGVMRNLLVKYGAMARAGAMREVLLAAQAELQDQRYLLGSFSYADIVVASMLQPHESIARSQPCTREAWTFDVLREFPGLIAWRARLLAETNPRLAAHAPLAA
jgi:glutathione S-transferase